MPSKELTWTDLFGSLPSDSSKFESTPFLTNNSDIDQLMKSLGKTLIKDIHFFDNLLKNPKMDPMAKMQCEYILNEIKKFAYPDIKYLCHLHARLLGATLMANSPLIIQNLESQIIPVLEGIINYQSTILKMKACYVTKTAKKRSLLSNYEEQILDHVRNAKYEEAVITATNVTCPVF